MATALVHSPAALGVIPAGTLNHFARDLAIPLDAQEAAQCVRDGQEITVDVGRVNDRIFINNSVLGVYPAYRSARLAFERSGHAKGTIARSFAVVKAIVRVFWRLPHLNLRLQTGAGEVYSVRTPFVLVANNEHEVENWNIGHRRSIDKGRLWVYVMRHSSRWAALRFLIAFLLKRFSKDEAFDIYCAQKLQVSGKSDFMRVGVDGEIVRMKTPLTYHSIPQALKVIAPAGYSANGTE